jgi:hypothetical protein
MTSIRVGTIAMEAGDALPLYSVFASQKAQLVQQPLRRTLKNGRLKKGVQRSTAGSSLDYRTPSEFARALNYSEGETPATSPPRIAPSNS